MPIMVFFVSLNLLATVALTTDFTSSVYSSIHTLPGHPPAHRALSAKSHQGRASPTALSSGVLQNYQHQTLTYALLQLVHLPKNENRMGAKNGTCLLGGKYTHTKQASVMC